jgi:hypothetical protein
LKYKPHMAALAAGVGLMAFATPAMADLGDVAVKQNAPEFRLNPYTLEPGCFQVGSGYKYRDVEVDSHIDVQENTKQAHITVDPDANFSIDQALIPGRDSGYNVYNTFDTGSVDNDADIDPDQTATDLEAPDGDDVDYAGKIIVCVSDHPAEQNEPYIEDGLPGEVAAINRPIIQPLLSCIGASAVEPLNTYKLGFGYGVAEGDWYDTYWADQFRNDGVFGPGLSFGDPQAFDTDGDDHFDHVFIKNRAEQAGVRRFNDFDEFGEEFNNPHSEKTSYGQPVVFHENGDPYAYLHKSLPGTVDGGGIGAVWAEALADQTSALGLLTFTAQGDLPMAWHLKASLAPEDYARSVMLDETTLEAWEAGWQAYYDGTGTRPAMPLCPGTNSPADNGREAAPAPAPAPAGPATTNTITREVTTVQTVAGATQVVKSAAAKATKKAKKAKKASCMKKAKAKKSKKARKNAMKKCRRIK